MNRTHQSPILFLILLLFQNGAQAALVSGRPQTLECRRLIQSLLGGIQPSSSQYEISDQAQAYLKLIEVGLSHLGTEVPALLNNLHGISVSSPTT